MPRFAGIAIGLVLALTCLVVAADKDKGKAKDKNKTVDMAQGEKLLLDWTNEARVKEKLPAFKVNETLVKVARGHSANQAKQAKETHVLDGKNVDQRVDDAGYNFATCNENVASSEDADWKAVFEAWMKSPVHKANILNKGLEDIGIGIAREANGKYYFTQVFGTLMKE